jgi:hypothetical protein
MSNTPTAADNTVVTIYNNCDDGSGCCSGGGGGGDGGGGGGDCCCNGDGSGDHSNLSGVYAGYFDDGSGSNFRANFTLFADGNVSLNSSRQSFAVPGTPFGTLQSLAPSVGRWNVFNGSELRILLTSLGQDAVNAQERRTTALNTLVNGEIPLSLTVAAGSGAQSIRIYSVPNTLMPTLDTPIAALQVFILERLDVVA